MAKRIFLAVPIPKSLKIELEKPLETIPGKIVPVSNWHFTVQFLGEIDESECERLIAVLKRLDVGSSFPITLGGLGAFPDEKAAKVLWIGLSEGRETFSRFADHLTEILKQVGFKVDFRSTIPHLTIRRFYPPRRVSEWIKTIRLKPLVFEVNELVVYESVLKEGPAEYIPLASFSLRVGTKTHE